MIIEYKLSAHDNGYRIRDWFEGGQATLLAAGAATHAEDAERILKTAYLGPDTDGVDVSWIVLMPAMTPAMRKATIAMWIVAISAVAAFVLIVVTKG